MNNSNTFPAHQYIQMSAQPVTRVTVLEKGISVERKKFSLHGGTFTESYSWDEIIHIELHHKTNLVNARRPGFSDGTRKQLYIYTRKGTIRLDLSTGGPFENPTQLLKLVREYCDKDIAEIRYTSLINQHPILFFILIGITVLTPIVIRPSPSMSKMIAPIEFVVVFALLAVFCLRYTKK